MKTKNPFQGRKLKTPVGRLPTDYGKLFDQARKQRKPAAQKEPDNDDGMVMSASSRRQMQGLH